MKGGPQASSMGKKAWDPAGAEGVAGAPIPIQLRLKGEGRKWFKITVAVSSLRGMCFMEQGQTFYTDYQVSKVYPGALCCLFGSKVGNSQDEA